MWPKEIETNWVVKKYYKNSISIYKNHITQYCTKK